MENCTLCGGKVINGKCTECGLDNTKNDRKYNLNTHNDKAIRFHSDDCEANLNRKSSGKTGKSRSKAADTGYRSSTASIRDGGRTAGGTTVRTGAARQKQLRERRQTGTVQRKKGKRWLIILICLFYLIGMLINMAEERSERVESFIDEIGERIGIDSLTDVFNEQDDVWDDEDDEVNPAGDNSDGFYEEKPEIQEWDQADPDYYEMILAPGYYTAGYELPAGSYQLSCEEGTAWIEWTDLENDETDYVYLVSDQVKEEYDDIDGYYSVSEVIDLPEESVISVETGYGQVKLTGLKSEGSGLMKHEPQNIKETFVLDNGMLMTVGEDMPAGVYDVEVGDEDVYANVTVEKINNETAKSLYLGDQFNSVCRIPLEDGDTVDVEIYGDQTKQIKLVPSY